MRPTRHTFIQFTFGTALIALCAVAGYAQTADGETPAVEEVCDELSGAAFGLCDAYCEAMDCELLEDGDPETFPAASEKACLKIKNNFIKVTGLASFPCEDIGEPQCPDDDGTEGCVCSYDEECARGFFCDSGFCVD